MPHSRFFLSIFAGLALLAGCASTEEAPWDETRINLAVSSTMNEHRQDFANCYDQELTRRDQLKPKPSAPQGVFKAAFTIGREGEVLEAEIVNGSSTLRNPPIERCILETLKKIRFGKMGDYSRYNVTYPFEFGPAPKR